MINFHIFCTQETILVLPFLYSKNLLNSVRLRTIQHTFDEIRLESQMLIFSTLRISKFRNPKGFRIFNWDLFIDNWFDKKTQMMAFRPCRNEILNEFQDAYKKNYQSIQYVSFSSYLFHGIRIAQGLEGSLLKLVIKFL